MVSASKFWPYFNIIYVTPTLIPHLNSLQSALSNPVVCTWFWVDNLKNFLFSDSKLCILKMRTLFNDNWLHFKHSVFVFGRQGMTWFWALPCPSRRSAHQLGSQWNRPFVDRGWDQGLGFSVSGSLRTVRPECYKSQTQKIRQVVV